MRLPLLLACSTVLSAVELPVTSLTVLPDALIVERAGSVPIGDDQLSGLPEGLDESSLVVEAGDQPVDGWRLVRAQAALPQPADPALLARIAKAERAAALANHRLDLMTLATTDGEGSSETKPLDPAALASLLALTTANAERAEAELSAARAALAETVAPPAAVEPNRHATLVASGLGGQQVRLRYRARGATWHPSWRIEIDDAQATLVQLATIDLTGEGSPVPVPVTIATRGRADSALLPDPRVPVLGLQESVDIEHDLTIRKGGGIKESECSASTASNWLSRYFAAGTGSAATDALCGLTFLGAGYDHRTPSRYKNAMQSGLYRLQTLDPHHLDLATLALVTTTLSEAVAMTDDAALRPKAAAALTTLCARWPGELPGLLLHSGPLTGPTTAAWIASAMKSGQAAGLTMDDSLARLRSLNLGVGEEAEIATRLIAIYAGARAEPIDAATVAAWTASFDRWWSAGRSDLLRMAVLVAFQAGGEAWKSVNTAFRDRLISLRITDGDMAGLWPMGHHQQGIIFASAELALSLEVYYRYAQVSAPRTGAAASGDMLPPPPSFPIRLSSAAPVALRPGRQEVELRRIHLSSALCWFAVPASSTGVWRRLEAANPWPGSLPAGPVLLVADGRILGRTHLDEIPVGGKLSLDLGPDDRLRVRRVVRSATDDGTFRRTLAVTVTCTVEGPPDFVQPIRVSEALPAPTDGVEVELLAPRALSGKAYATFVASSPAATTELRVGLPAATLYDLKLTYARDIRPSLEVR